MQELNILQEFEELLDPLTTDEYNRLQEDILDKGVLDPIKVWQGYIIDGHNRYNIAQSISLDGVRILDMTDSFNNEDEVKMWMIDQQLGKRNVTPEKKKYLIGIRYSLEKQEIGDNQHVDMSTPSFKPTEEIAKEYGMSRTAILDWAAYGSNNNDDMSAPFKPTQEEVSNRY